MASLLVICFLFHLILISLLSFLRNKKSLFNFIRFSYLYHYCLKTIVKETHISYIFPSFYFSSTEININMNLLYAKLS